MECLEKYRRGLVREANRQLRAIFDSADETAVHDFRVAVKRLTAFYRFLRQVEERLPVKRWLQPCRALFKRGGEIRNAQIAIGLIDEADDISSVTRRSLLRPLQGAIRRDYRRFQRYAREQRITAIRLPSIAATGITQAAIRRHRPIFLEQLRAGILAEEQGSGNDEWHARRILLKRYHHMLDAFALCPGYGMPTSLLKQIVLLEQLLGDWHDRVTTIELLGSRFANAKGIEPLVSRLHEQQQALLGASRIYLDKLGRNWPE